MSAGEHRPAGTQRESGGAAHPARGWWVIVAIMVAAINLRPPVTAVGALLGRIQQDLGLSGVAAGLLTTLPVCCLGVFAFATPRLRDRLGEEGIIMVALPVLLFGALVRLLPSLASLLAGTVLVGAGIAVVNVVLPALIKREFPARVARVTSIYTMVVVLGASVGSGTVVPMMRALPGGWRAPMLVLAAPLALAAGVWLVAGRRMRRAAASTGVGGRSLWRSSLTWQVTTFFGTQSLLAYVVFGWLPTIAVDRGLSPTMAGLLLSVSALVQVAGSLTLPLLDRGSDQRPLTTLVAAVTGVGLLGVIVMPVSQIWLWAVVLGLGQGGGFALALTLIGLRAGDTATASQLSGVAQGSGYLIAAFGPFLVGLLHSLTAEWTAVLALLLAVGAAQVVAGLGAGRATQVRAA